MLVSLWFIITSLVFLYLFKLFLPVFLQFKCNFVHGKNTSYSILQRVCICFSAQDLQNTTATQTQEIYPNEVKSLPETSKLESDLVAPAPGRKPLVAKYTLRVKPKLLNGVPQTQEIRIMPPNKAGTAGYVKPLMVLKQNITKPMIENIEIDVPRKGAKFSSKPSVEVIEGDHTEMLKVSKGQAIVEDPVQKSATKSEGKIV